MNLINVRLLKVCSSISVNDSSAFGLLRTTNSWQKFICLKNFVKCSALNKSVDKIQTLDSFQYQYESNELIGTLEALTMNSKAFSIDQFHTENSLLFSNQQIIQSKDDVQLIVTALILAAKTGQNVEHFINNKFGENTIHRLLDYLEHSSGCIEAMTADEIVQCLIALHLLNIPLHHPINRKLIAIVSNMLRGKFNRIDFEIYDRELMMRNIYCCRFTGIPIEIVIKFSNFFST